MSTRLAWAASKLLALAVGAAATLLAADLPAGAVKALDQRYPGWRLADAAPQIVSWFREYHVSYAPNLARADFNSDGRDDFAVQILHKGRQRVVSLIGQPNGFAVFALTDDPPDPFTFLILFPKGQKDFDFERMKPFRYNADSLGVLYFYKTALTFQWKGGRFEKNDSPGDEEVEAEQAENNE